MAHGDGMAVFPGEDTIWQDFDLQFTDEHVRVIKRDLVGRWPWQRESVRGV